MIYNIFWFLSGFFTCGLLLLLVALFYPISKPTEDLKDINELSKQNQTKRGL